MFTERLRSVRCVLLSALLLVGCGPHLHPIEPNCITRHHTPLYRSDDCGGLALAQEALVLAVEEEPTWFGFTREQMLARFVGLEVWVREAGGKADDGVWTTEDGQSVAGRSYCGRGGIELANDDWGLNAFVHEVIHQEQDCTPGHWLWVESGISSLIYRAQYLYRLSVPKE